MLKRKMFRDIMRHKTQFISIFLMAFLATFIYTGIGGEWRGLQHSADTYYEATNLADVTIWGESFSEEQEKAVADVMGITATERRTIVKVAAKEIADQQLDENAKIDIHFVEKNEISKLYLVEGKDFDINDKDGIWLGERFTNANKLKIGDTILMSAFGVDMEKEIKGIIHAPEYVFMESGEGMTPDFKNIGYAYMSAKAFPVAEHFSYTNLLIKASNLVDLEKKINTALEGKYSVYLEAENHPSVEMFKNETIQHKMMGDIFPIVFLLVALLTMMTTMTRIVDSQRIQIGTLKALGFRRGVILRHYVSYGFWLALFGAGLGGIVGPLTLPRLFYPSMSSFYTIPEWKATYHWSFTVVTVLVIVLCTAMTWRACAKQLKDTPSQTLRQKAPKISKHNFLEKTVLWRNIGFTTQWNLRDATRNKIRSLMAIIGVFGCTALLTCAFGMNDSMKVLKEWQYGDIYQFESKLKLEEMATQEQIDELLEVTKGEGIMESAIEIRTNGIKKSGFLLVTDNTTLIEQTDKARKVIELPKTGVAMSTKLASVFGLKVGDSIEWHIYGDQRWVKTEIVALYSDPSTQGLVVPRETFEKLQFTFQPTSVITAEKVNNQYDGVASVFSTSELMAGWEDLTEAMMLMVYILIGGAALLSVVVLYNLGLLSFTEMERDMATLKVMGMRTKKLRGLLLVQNVWFSMIGFAIGLPAGIQLVKMITDSSGDSFDFPVKLTGGTAMLAFVITFGLSIFVSLLFSGKIKRLNMVEALKASE